MSDTTHTGPQSKDWTHLHGCTACARHNRASAYRWLGEKHSIPALHGAGWLSEDLKRAIGSLELGEELELDYRGDTANAPRIVVHRSEGDVITASGPDGWLHCPSQTRWSWQPSDNSRRIKEIVFALLGLLTTQRGASGVILIPPHG